MKLTSNQARAAREKLGISQATVCRETGISRNIMSAFEQEKIVLLDDMQLRLGEFFADHGIEIGEGGEVLVEGNAANDDDASELPSALDGWPEDNHIRDGFCIPSSLGADVVGELLVELAEVDAEIQSLTQTGCSTGWLDRYSEECDAQVERLLLLCVRWRDIVLALRGYSPELDSGGLKQSVSKEFVGDRIAKKLRRAGLIREH